MLRRARALLLPGAGPLTTALLTIATLTLSSACSEVSDEIVDDPGLLVDVPPSAVDGHAYSKDAGGPEGANPGPGETPGPGACMPDCFGKICGDDGCGGSCGECGAGESCKSGTCVVGGTESCTPDCFGKPCGDDGCGGQCGECGPGMVCAPGGNHCVSETGDCKPDCLGKFCGPDGCGGTCGSCAAGDVCDGAGQCVGDPGVCNPDCFGKACGDDGCGGQCGKCAPGEVCDGNFQCVASQAGCGGIPESGVCEGSTVKWCFEGNIFTLDCDPAIGLKCGWNETQNKFDCVEGSCTPDCAAKQCGPDGCGGKCGICPQGESCTQEGQCSANCVADCAGKSCGPNGCGGSCGTCPGGQVCGGDGQCKAGNCVPNCVDKTCGPDGCGGKCGICPAGQSCTPGGTCQAGGCTSDCVGKGCGDDGCGGSCGSCPSGQSCGPGFKCQDGPCAPQCGAKECGDNGCGGLCGNCGPGQSCSPQGVCQDGGCTPDCADKQCGPDGCGGKCGICPSGQSCNAGGKCSDATGCTAECAGKDCGPDGCGGTCGICEPGTSCGGDGLCAPGAPTGEGCGDIDYKGVCEGNTLKYCSGESLTTIDCTESGKVCSFDATSDWFDCVEEGEACVADCGGKVCGDDGCGGSCGACAAGLVCAGGECSEGGGACGDVTYQGACEGDLLKYCAADSLQVVDCAAQDKSCGFDADNEWYDCLEGGGPCVPDCTGKIDGDADGCGGTCGEGPGPEGCGDVDSKGICEGKILKYCAGDSLTSVDCGAQDKTCGYDATFDWYDCVEGDAPCVPDCTGKINGDPDGCGGSCGGGEPPPVEGCGDVTAKGQCAGNTLKYCAGEKVNETDCTSFDKVCGYDEGFDWFDCVDGESPCAPDCAGKADGEPDGCGGACGGDGPAEGCGELGYEGECEGDTLKYCSGSSVVVVDCASQAKSCGFDATFEWYDCLDAGGPCTPDCTGKAAGEADGCGGVCAGQGDACGDIDSKGLCDGNTLKYCAGGALKTFDCATYDKVCGYDVTFDWFDCVDDTGPCTPDCAGKAAGDPDGCGGSCGGGPVEGCGDIDSKGKCEGNVLSYCAGDTVKTVDCGTLAKVCDYDAGYDWYDCVDGDAPCTPDCAGKVAGEADGCGGLCSGDGPPSGCGDITFQGVCEGNTLSYCQGDALQVVDCASDGKVCGYDEANDWYECIEGDGPPPSGCDGLDSKGKCEGEVLSYCSGGEVKTFDCTEYSKTCGYDETFDWYDCLDSGACTPDCLGKGEGEDDGCGGTCAGGAGGDCGDVTQVGQCEGDTLTYCSAGSIKTFDCTTYGKTCGYDDAFDWYDCVEGDGPCTPDCAGKAAGDPDGCGGACAGGGGGECGDVNEKGQCAGDVLSYCSAGALKTFDCTAYGKTCGYDASFDWFDCIEGDAPTDCGGIGEAGVCEGNTLKYCAGGELETHDCEALGKVCGANPDTGYFDCVEGDGPPTGDCGAITDKGECEGNTLKYCAGGQLKTFDCTGYDKVCGFDAAFDWYDCIEDSDGPCTPDCAGKAEGDADGCGGTCPGDGPPTGDCGGITQKGTCDGDTLKYCSGDQLKTFDCTAYGKVCGYDAAFDWFDCVEGGVGPCTPDCSGKACGDDGCGGSCGSCGGGETCNASGQCISGGDGCGGIDDKGVCEGNTLKYCAGGELKTFDCTTYSKVCGYDAAFDWYDCVEDGEAPCTPSCGGKNCGDDGCGGSCGTCPGGQTCSSGVCTGGGGDACGGVTEKGTCEGNTLKYCAGGQLKTFDCTTYSKVCGYDASFDWYDCVEDTTSCTPDCSGKSCGDDGCGGSCGSCPSGQTCSSGSCEASGGGCGSLGSEGKCEGNTLKYCSAGAVKTFDCTAYGKICGWDAANSWYDCVEDATSCTPNCSGKECGGDGCGGSCGSCGSGESCQSGSCVTDSNCGSVDEKGKCEGKTLKYCASGELKSFYCPGYGKICGYDSGNGWYDCIEDPDACTPSCGGKECGSDGCGGSCGSCGSGESCNGGTCEASGGGGCGGITYEGKCEGDTLKYCDNDNLQVINCKDYGGTCGYKGSAGYYDCIYD